MKRTHQERIQRCHIQFMSNKDWVHLVGVMMVGKVTIKAAAYADCWY